MKEMNCFICALLAAIAAIAPVEMNAQEKRNTLWADGSTPTSKGWIDFRNGMVNWKGYQLESLNDATYITSAIGNGVQAAADHLDGRVGSAETVLGIAHGFSGIALRYAQHQNSNISAMILCGVPNQGSLALDKATKVQPGFKTHPQLIIEKVEALKAGNNCMDCDVTGLFKSFIDELALGKDFLIELTPEHDVIKTINQPSSLPSVPYAVLYGFHEDFSLTRMLDTRGSSSDTDHIVRCQAERIRRESKHIDNLETIRTIRNTNGFFANALAFLGSLVSASSGNVGAVISAMATYLNSGTNSLIQEIEADAEIERQLARMLRCQLANQVQEAEWMLMMLNDLSLQEKVIELPDWQSYSTCLQHCDIGLALGGGINLVECDAFCAAQASSQAISVTVWVAEPTDGLLRVSEQKLPGALLAAEIPLPNTNHLQETLLSNPVLVEAFEDLFDGTYGAAFFVPKN
jgi:hypothetical protein